MHRRLLVSSAAVVIVMLFAQTAFALVLAPSEVYDPPANQWLPFRNTNYLLYSSNSTSAPKHFNAYARDLVGGTNRRLNLGGTQGGPGGFDPGTNVAIFQEWGPNGSDAVLYDLDTDLRLPVPRSLRSAAWEWDPRISTAYISFFREVKVNGIWYTAVVLYDRTTHALTKVARYKSSTYMANGTLGETYATWSVCTRVTCSVWVYDATLDTLTSVPAVNGRPQYAPAVDEVTGTLFFVRSGFGCGLAVTFLRVPVATPLAAPTKVGVLPGGIDVDTASVSNGDLVFSRVVCGEGSGIYALPGVAT